MDEAAIWTTHLRPGETIVWRGAESRAMLKASHASQRFVRLGMALVSTIIASALGYRFVEAVFAYASQPDLSSAIAAPLYLIFGLALAVLALFSFLRVVRRPPEPAQYAATNQRLLSLDAAGRMTGEIAGADITNVEQMDRDSRTHLLVTGRGTSDPPVFSLNNIENPAAVAAMIQTTFPEATP